MTAQNLTAKQARWASMLSEFFFEILHIPGRQNPADPASRRSDYADKRGFTTKVVLLGHREQERTKINAVRVRRLKITKTFDPSTVFMPADEKTLTALRALYDTDELLLKRTPPALSFIDHTWWWRDKIYVPMAMRDMILKQVHETPSAGHWGSMKTLDLLTRTFDWPNARADVLKFCSLCISCQSIKVDRRPPQGRLNPLPIPDRPWSTIGVDFIVKLPNSDGWDSVMVVVDHFSKAAHFIPAKETWTADMLAKAFINHVFKLHGLPEKIVSDRGTTFMSHFWTSVLDQLRISPAPSTAFHPQTDGQVERINALLEDYLRHFVSLDQNDWASWLSMAEFSYNNTPSSSTKFSPFFAIHGFHPRYNSLVASSGVPAADQFVKHLQDIQEQLALNLTRAKEDQARFYNKDRRIDVKYSPGDFVWLSRRHIKTRRQNAKLDVRRLGPFRVRQMVGSNAAELELPPTLSRLHPVFNVSLLMPFISEHHSAEVPLSTQTQELDFLTDFVDWASTAYVMDYRCLSLDTHEYLMRGQNHSVLDDEWRLLTTLSPHLDQFLRRFHQLTPQRGEGPSNIVWESRASQLV